MENIKKLALNIQLFADEGADSAAESADNAEKGAEGAESTKPDSNKESVKDTKTFTQDEVNEIVKTRIAKEKKGIPSKEELQEFTNWKESQKTAEEKQAEKEKENQKVLAERDNLKRENLLLRKGVNDDDLDYVLFKVSKLEGEFEENLNKYLADNPKYLKSYENKSKTISLGDDHKQTADNNPKDLRSALRQKYKK